MALKYTEIDDNSNMAWNDGIIVRAPDSQPRGHKFDSWLFVH